MILRYSIPAFSVCAPFVHVTESLMMNVGRVVTLPMLTPALLPNCANPSLNCHLRRHVVSSHAGDLREVIDEALVHRAVPLVAVQVPHRHVVQQRAAEGAIPVEPAHPRVLRIRIRLAGNRLRQDRHELGGRALVPDAREEVVAALELHVEPAHVVVGVAEDGVRNRRPEVIVQRAAGGRIGQRRQPRPHQRADAIGTNHVRRVAVAAPELILDVAPLAIGTDRQRVVDRDEVAAGVAPISEVAGTLEHRWNR